LAQHYAPKYVSATYNPVNIKNNRFMAIKKNNLC